MSIAFESLRDADLPVDFGRYTLTSLLGVGGMGRVFRAQLRGPEGFRKEVALKVIGRSSTDDARAQQEFVREARYSGLLKHPNVVDIYDFGVTDGRPWLAMEIVDGGSLQALLSEGALPATAALDLGIQVCDALSHAHGLQVDGEPVELVHRDLKPGNIVVTPRGVAKVLDFGLARAAGGRTDLTASGTVRGTPAYMAPEQARGDELDPRTDLFALGIILFEALTGRNPLIRDNLVAVMMAIIQLEDVLDDPATLADADAAAPGVSAVLRKLLRQDPGERYPRASEVAADLRALLASLPPGPDLRRHVSGAPPSPSSASALSVPPTVWAPPPGSHGSHGTWSTRPSRALARRTNLGPDSASFVGRAEDLAAVGRAFAEGARLVTLLGPGGTGKTRLARRHAASRLADLLPHGGVWFVDASGATTAQGVLHVVAITLDVPVQGTGDGAAEQLAHALADRGPMLLVLDNLEQVIGPALPLLRRWLATAPALQLLVTSRERLRLPAEVAIELGPLGEAEAIALFEERAGAVRRGFVLKEADREAVAEIVRRLDCLPLAVELAAARTSVMAPRKILERLSERFRLLSDGRADGKGTLRGTIQWSWDLLEPTEQSALAQCAVFRGGFTLEAAEEVLDLGGGAWALDVVQALRDKSLLRSWEPPGLDGEVRFGMYESLRVFAAEQLDASGRREGTEARHAEAMIDVGEGLAASINGVDGVQARRQLALELDNLHAVWEHQKGRDVALAGDAILAIAPLLLSVGPADLLRTLLDDAIATVAARNGPERSRFQLHMARAELLMAQGDVPRGLLDADAARELAGRLGDQEARCRALALAARLHAERGDSESATPLAEQAVAIARGLDAPEALGLALRAQGYALGFGRDEALETALVAECLAIWRRLGDKRREADEIAGEAANHGNRGRIDLAQPLFEQALELHRQVGTRRGEGMAQGNLALVALQLGRFQEARRRARKAAEIHRLHGSRTPYGVAMCNLGCTQLLQGELADALRSLQESVDTLAGVGRSFYLAIAARDLAIARLMSGELDRAEAAARQSVDAAEQQGGGALLPVCHAILGAVLAVRGELIEADTCLHAASQGADERGDTAERALVRLAEALRDLHLPEGSGDRAAAVEAALDLHLGHGYPPAERDPDRPFDSTLRLLRSALGQILVEGGHALLEGADRD